MNPNRLYSFATAALVAAILAVSAHASLLTGNEVQLETWLGKGDLDFTNIFTKVSGDTSATLHAAIDGKGATFSLLNAYTWNPQTQKYDIGHLIGGYDPWSWYSNEQFIGSLLDAERTAFIYNLTSDTIHRQNLAGEGNPNSQLYQTFNSVTYPLAFGLGYDLAVMEDLNSGGAFNYSYGGTSEGTNIVGKAGGTLFEVGEIEVYTFTPATATASVTDTAGTLGLLSISMLGLVAFRRRFAS